MSPIQALSLAVLAVGGVAATIWLSRRITAAVEWLSEPGETLQFTPEDVQLASEELRRR